MEHAAPKKSWFNLKVRRMVEKFRDASYGIIGQHIKGFEKTPVFLLGTQRSGTTMLIGQLRMSPYCLSFEESDPRAMREMRLRDENVIHDLIRKDPHCFLIFKPLNDSQYLDTYLDRYDSAKVLWMYRSYGDVINSAVDKWGDWQKTIVLWIKNNYGTLDLPPPRSPTDKVIRDCAIYTERMREETWQRICELADENISSQEGAALLWYLRNQIYFDLHCEGRDDVLLVRYEELVTNPDTYLKRVFDFLGCEYKVQFSDNIHTSSVRKQDSPQLRPGIKQACEEMQKRLNRVYDEKQ